VKLTDGQTVMTKACKTLPVFSSFMVAEHTSTSVAEGEYDRRFTHCPSYGHFTSKHDLQKPSNDCCFVYIGDNPCLNFLLISNDYNAQHTRKA